MGYVRGNKNEAASGDRVFFILKPELHFSPQIVGIFMIVTEKTDNFTRVMAVGRERFLAGSGL